MKTHTFGNGILGTAVHEKWSVPKWTRFISVVYFSEAVIFFLFSFILFFVKRTHGVDPHLVSGAYDGTTQLTYFIGINILSMITALHGYYLFRYSRDFTDNNESNDFLRLYFKTAGIFTIPVFIAVISVVLYLILG